MIGDRIKEARLTLGYSAEQVAAFLQVSPATVYRYENGDISKLPSKFIKPLADYLCVSPEWLMGWSDDKSSKSGEPPDNVPKNEKVRLLMNGINKLSDEQVEQLTDMMKVMFAKTNPDLFEKGSESDDHT